MANTRFAFRVTASNLTPEEKDSVKRIVMILGGQYTIKMGHKNSHLIVPFAAGEKFEGAIRYKVVPVTSSWLIDSARSGEEQSFTCERSIGEYERIFSWLS